MADIYDKAKRSLIMSMISSSETKPEILVRKFLFSKGFRFRKNVKSMPGKPDIVLAKYKTVIFIHGCFWHGHYCKAAKLPKTHEEFWIEKISDNKNRDGRNISNLKKSNWKVLIIYQCELKNKFIRENTLSRLVSEIICSR